MRTRTVVSSLGSIYGLASVAFLPPAVIAYLYEPKDLSLLGTILPRNAAVFVAAFAFTFLAGGAMRIAAGRVKTVRDIEGYAIVALGWLTIPVFFAIPLLLTALPNVPDALFEAMSGLTTTGFTVVPDVDALAPSVILWRSLMQWIGGGGIAVLSVAVLARLTESGARLMRAELPGGSVTRLKPKITQTAKSLYGVYLALTLIVFSALLLALVGRLGFSVGDAAWEAVNITFATVATGGFVPHSEGLARYPDAWVHWIIVGGMILGGTSFTLLYFAVHGEPRRLLRDPEWRFFLILIVAGGAALTLILAFTRATAWGAGQSPTFQALGVEEGAGFWELAWPAFSSSVFHVTSIMTTTGFATMDYDLWPEAARIILLLFMFTGACAGSTAGALKLARTLLLVKVARREILKLVNPNAYVPVRVGGAIVSEDAIRGIIAFFFAYIALFITSTIFVSLYGYDLFTAASASAASIGNVGVGLGFVGPAFNLSALDPAVKLWLTVMMWLGRLEIFAALLLFFPSTYQR